MDPSKRNTLIQWINAINPHETIESLQELRDGEQLISLLSTITSSSYAKLLTRKERFEVIQKFINDYYNYDFSGQVNFDRDNELDMAKMLILVLSAGVQGEYQEQFMTPALSLDQRSQMEIMNILKEIVSDCPNKLNLDNLLVCRSEDTFDSTDVSCLFSPEKTPPEDKSCPAFTLSKAELQNRSTSTSSLNEIMSPFQRINVGLSPACTTPLHSLITSTGFSGRIIQRERNLRRKAENEIVDRENLIKKLTSELNMERHLRSDNELEMQEKIRTINSKDDKIRDLMTQNRTLKQLQDRLDEMNTLKEEYEQMVTETEKSKSYVEELKDLRLQNSSLKKEVNGLYEELHSLKEMQTQFKILQLDCNKYLEELHKEEKKYASLQSSLDLKQKAFDDAINSKNFTEDNLAKMKEMYEDVKRQYEELLAFQSANEPSGERMTVITDQLMDELKKELDDMKSTWTAPSTHEELKIKLANVVTERDTFESKSLKLCEEVLQVQSDNDMLKKKNENFEIELEKCQRHLQDSQRNIEKLTAILEAFDTKEAQWHHTEMKYKTELQQLQTKMSQMQMELSCVSTELKLANAQLECDVKSSEMRRQTLVQSFSELRNEKKMLEQTYEVDKAAVDEKAKGLKSQLETLKMEFASREQELLAQNESVAMERRELEQQLETERRHRDNMERNLTSQREEVENELNEMICQLKEDLKATEEETQRLRSQLREKIDEYDGQVESLTNVKFELQAKVNKLESQASLDKQERLKLQAEVKTTGERTEELEQNLGKLTEKLNKAIAEKKDCQEKLQDIEKKLEVAIEESRHWINKNSSDKKTFETKIMVLEQERAEFAESSRCALEKLSEELRSSLDKNCELRSQLQKQTDLLTETRAELEEKLQQLETVQEQLSQLQKLHSDLQEQNCLLNNNLVMTQSQLACKVSEVIDLERKLDELFAEKTCLVESHEKELGATRQALSQEIVNLNEQIESSKSALLGFVEQIVKVANSKFSTDDIDPSLDIEKLLESVGKDVFHTVEDHSKRLAVAEERCTLQETQLLQLEENLQVKLQEAEMLKEDLRESKAQCEQLQAMKDKQQQLLEENDALIKSMEEKKSSLDSQIVSERESFQARLDNASTECNTVRQLLEEKIACVAELKEQSIIFDSELKSVRQDMCQLEVAHNELQQRKKEIEEELAEKKLQLEAAAQKTSEMTLALTEKDSLIESQSEIQSHLEESIASLNKKMSLNDMEINLLKSDLEQKDALIKERNTELADLSETLELNQHQVMELKEEHMSAIAALQQELMLDYEQKLDAVVTDYENKICENYVGKSMVESLEAKHKAEIEELRGNLKLEYEKVASELQEDHEASMNALKSQFETQLSEYVKVEEVHEQNQKHFLEVEQLQNYVKEYQTKMESQEKEHKDALERVVLEYKEKIANEFIPNSVFDEHKERHLAEISQIQNELAVDHEKKVQHMVEQHQTSLKQLMCSYEEKLTTDYVLRQTVEEEKENLVLETRKSLEVELQEKTEVLQQEHETKMESQEKEHKDALERVVLEYEENIANDFIPNSVFDEHKERHSAEISQIQSELAVDHEKNVQHMVEQHQTSLKQLMCSYEEKLTTDYVLRQTADEEKENLVLETRKCLEVELQEKTEVLQQEHETKMESQEKEHKDALERVVLEYKEKIANEFIPNSVFDEHKERHLAEISQIQNELAVDHEKNVQHMVEQHQTSLKQLMCSYEEKLTTDYVLRQTADEEKENLVLETRKCLEVELQEKTEVLQQEHETKMESQEKEHKDALERVVLEYKEKIANEFIPNSVFDEHKERHLAEISQIQNELAVDHEKKVQHMVEQHQTSLKQLMCSYEEKLTTDYVLRQTVEEEKENLVLETRKSLEVELQEKTAVLQQEHKTLVAQNEQQHQEMLAENYVEKSALAKVVDKLGEKEKELLQQRAEFDLIVATSENVKEQHEASVRAYELRVSELDEKLEQQEMHMSCLEEQVVNEKFDGERRVSEIKRTLEEQLTEMRAQVGQLESCNRDEMTRLTENYQRDFEQMKQEYQAKIVELETTYKAEIDQLKECHLQEMSVSHNKYEEIHQNLLSAQSKAEEDVSLKEQEMKEILADTEKQLMTEKSLIEEKLSELESEFTKVKENHELVLKSNEEKIVSLNSCIHQLKDECRINQGKCDKIERQLRETEQKLILDNMKTLAQAEEMNKSLSNQLQVAQKEVILAQKKMGATQKQIDFLNNDLKLVKHMKQKAVSEVQEYKIHCLELKENFSSEKSKLEKNIRELKERCTESTAEIENLSKLVKHYKTREESKLSKSIEQSEADKKSIEKLTNKVAALEHEKSSLAEYLKQEEERFKASGKENRTLHRKVSDLTDQLEKAGNALFSSSNHEIDLQNDSLDSPDIKGITRRPYELRSRSGIWNRMRVEDFNVSPMSFQSRASTSSYKSVTSNMSSTSKTPVPPGCGQIFSCEDEPAPPAFDWGRITEIRRRNTMVPAHLRSTYPAELQNIPNSINEEIAKPSGPGSGKRKRKSPVRKTQQMKELRDRPATPGRLRRFKVRTNLNNENSPQSDKKRLRTTATPLPKTEYTGRPSMAFEISNTPKLCKRRQKGRSTIFQMPQPRREPLKQRNCHQTNL